MSGVFFGDKYPFMIGCPHPRRLLPKEAPHLHSPRRQVGEEVSQLVGETQKTPQLVFVLRGGELADGPQSLLNRLDAMHRPLHCGRRNGPGARS